MKVLIADAFERFGVDQLTQAGFEVVCEPALDGEALREALQRTGCSVLVVRSTRVTEAMLSTPAELALVVRAGAGVNTIDVRAASRRSILVANCPGKNAVAVAELTFALILALDRQLVAGTTDLQKGVWNKKQYSQARGLKDRTLGIVGMGQIGRAVAARGRAFELPVVAWSPSLTDQTAAEAGVTRAGSPAEVAGRCDILTVHLAAVPETKGLIGAEVLGKLRPGSYVINTARAEVVDYEALAAVVREKHIRVGLDVYPNEPSVSSGAFEAAIVRAGGVVYGTHHIGASTEQAQNAIAAETVRIIKTFAETGQAPNCVNVRETSAANWCLTVRHLNKPGVLAHVLGALSHAGLNVEEMENTIMSGSEAACAHIRLDAAPSADVLETIRQGSSSVLGVALMSSVVPPRSRDRASG